VRAAAAGTLESIAMRGHRPSSVTVGAGTVASGASPTEGTLVERTLATRVTPRLKEILEDPSLHCREA